MAKVEEQESNDNEGSIQSSMSKENDIKNRLRKNHNKKKIANSDEFVQKKTKKVSGTYWRDPCKEILDKLKKDEKAALFRHPAVRSFAKQEDKEYYKEQIKEPRDLGTITKKLKHENYTPKDFKNDIELCWSNALTFNESDTEVYHCAEYLKEFSDKLFKEKSFNEILEKYNNEKENNNNADEKDMNTNDNSNNNTNDSNHTGDKLNLNESGILENGIKEKNGDNNNDNDSDKVKKKEKKRKDSSETNSSFKSHKEEESYNESETKKHHHHHKMTGKKRRRHRHKDKDKEKYKEENNGEEKKEKKRGRRKRKIDNDDIIKISKRKINFEDIKKKYPINYPVIASPEEIERMAKKNGKNKIKKMVKLNNTNKNHDNHHKNENHKRRGRNVINNNANNVNSEDKNKKITYQFDWEFLEKGDEQKIDYILIDNKDDPERRKFENEQMANYDINCNSDNIQITHKPRNTNVTHNNTNEIPDNTQKKKKNELNKNKNTNVNNSNININNVNVNNNDVEINKDINNINNIEIVQKSNNVSMDNSINEIKMISEINNAVKIVDKGYEKSMELRIEIAKNFDNLTDSNMIDLLVYIENIRPQAIRILENDTIYIDMEAFSEDTFNKVFDYIKNVI